jgi:hypothetical protein
LQNFLSQNSPKVTTEKKNNMEIDDISVKKLIMIPNCKVCTLRVMLADKTQQAIGRVEAFSNIIP